MVLRGLPEAYSSFIVVITQSDKDYTFVALKTAFHTFHENLKSRSDTGANNFEPKDSAMKTKEHNTTRLVKCYGCKKIGHEARNCPTLQCSNCNIKATLLRTVERNLNLEIVLKFSRRMIMNIHLRFLTQNMVMLLG